MKYRVRVEHVSFPGSVDVFRWRVNCWRLRLFINGASPGRIDNVRVGDILTGASANFIEYGGVLSGGDPVPFQHEFYLSSFQGRELLAVVEYLDPLP